MRDFVAQRPLDLVMRRPLVASMTLIAALALVGPASAATTVRAHPLGAIGRFAQMTVWPHQGAWVAIALAEI